MAGRQLRPWSHRWLVVPRVRYKVVLILNAKHGTFKKHNSTVIFSNLNGQYLNGPVPQEFEYKGMYWYDYQGPQYSLMRSKMMIRPYFNAVGLGAVTGTTVKPRSPQVPAPPSNQGRLTFGPKLPNQQGQKSKKKKEVEQWSAIKTEALQLPTGWPRWTTRDDYPL